MKKIVVLLLLLTVALMPIASATTSELVWKEHPWLYKFGIGDRVYKVTYDDGNIIYQYVRGTFLKPAEIAYKPVYVGVPVGGDPSGAISIPISFRGISCSLTNSNLNKHTLDFYYSPGGVTPQHIAQASWNVQCGEITQMFSVTIPNNYFGNIINNQGEYYIAVKETAYIGGVPYGGEDTAIWLRVLSIPTATPTPTPTVTLGQGQCKDSYGNIFTCTTSTATATATPTPSAGTGQISVSSNVQGDVYIDGSKVGTTGATGSTFTVSGGGHTVKVTQTGYNDYTTSVTVDSGRTSSVTATLTAASTSGDSKGGTAQGYIIVWSSPSEAKVYVNDVEKGTTGTDWLSVQMPVGTYTVKVIKGGYEAYSQSTTVVANDNAKVEARMTIISPPGNTATATSTGTPAATSGIAIESKTTKGSYECPQGTVWNADRTGCITPKKTIGEKIDQLPGFEALFAIAGLVAVAYLVLRQKQKKKKDDYEE